MRIHEKVVYYIVFLPVEINAYNLFMLPFVTRLPWQGVITSFYLIVFSTYTLDYLVEAEICISQ